MRGPRFLAVAAAAVVLVAAMPPSDAANAPMLIAHRGGAGLWPENTMGAFTNAQALFAAADVPGWLEMDTQFTSDHVLVVIHDETLDRTTECSGAVVDQPAETVTACDADPGPAVDPVPALSEVLDAGAGGWRLMIEIKDIPGEPGFDADCNELADALRTAVTDAGFPTENLIVESFWPLCLERLEATAPEIATLLLTSSSTFNDLAGLVTPVPLGFTLTANAVFATLRGYEYSSPDQDTIDLIGPVVAATHLLGRKVIVWTVDEVARMQELAGIGVDGLISDRPDLLISTLSP